jgi:hypothetical protein
MPRHRSPNGTRKTSTVLSVRDVGESTKDNISFIAYRLGLTQGQVVERAIGALYRHTIAEMAEQRKAKPPLTPGQQATLDALMNLPRPQVHRE